MPPLHGTLPMRIPATRRIVGGWRTCVVDAWFLSVRRSVIDSLGSGAWFGEIALLQPTIRTVRAPEPLPLNPPPSLPY